MQNKVVTAKEPFEIAALPTATARFNQLDGLRGVASVAVFLWHHFIAFFPASIGISNVMHSRVLEIWLYRSPLAILFAGDLAVFVFFVLSGFVISVGYFRAEGIEGVKKSFLRRYVRLMPPAFVTIIAAYLILIAGLNFNGQAGPLTTGWWLALHWSQTVVQLKNAIWMGVYGMWFVPIEAGAQFNSNLGTLALELIGSFVVFATIIATRLAGLSFYTRLALYCCMFGLSIYLNINDPHYVSFYAGMALADIYVNRPRAFEISSSASLGILVLAVYLGAVNVASMTLPYYAPMAAGFRFLGLHPLSYPWMISSVLLVYGILTSRLATKVFSSKLAIFLGKYSFPLFLVHTIVLCSFTSFLFVYLSSLGTGYRLALTLSFACSLPVHAICVKCVHFVDVAATRLSRRF
jgi:peptidoglycan/LPS O-acetylase OafA/YrhL